MGKRVGRKGTEAQTLQMQGGSEANSLEDSRAEELEGN